jgi:signal transduction histidine kinase
MLKGDRIALILFFGYFIFLITIINDGLFWAGKLQTYYLIPLGLSFFILSHSIILSKKFVSAFFKIEYLSLELEEHSKNLEQKVEQRTTELKKANAEKDKFISVLAHDLKNSFGGIFGAIEMLKKYLNQMRKEQITEILDSTDVSARKGYSLLMNLLEWVKSQTGRILFKPANNSVKLILDDVIDYFEEQLKTKNIKLIRYLNENETIFCDYHMLTTVLRNLISNSIKFTRRGGEIIISIEKTEKHYKICISDNGVGIKKENLDKLLKIDSHFSSYGTEQEQGSGLGLLICKEFIDKHNGLLEIKSEENKGCEFIILLPKI